MKWPIVTDTKPIKVTLKKGDRYSWCTCGVSGNGPFCDSAHRNTDSLLKSKKFIAEEDGDAFLCMCKYTKNPPFCDGAHTNLPVDANYRENESSVTSTKEEPNLEYIHLLAKHGLSKTGIHGEIGAMGVPKNLLPKWDDIQILTAQLKNKPLLEDEIVNTELIIGKKAKKPLKLDIPLFVSDMSFGSLSEEAKIALAKGAEAAGTGICSGEGGMLPEEQANNSRYFYELGPSKFGYNEEILKNVQAFHFKCGQAAKTGIGGHLLGSKVKGKIAKIRQLQDGEDSISSATFSDLHTTLDFKNFANKVREITGGIPIGFKLSAQHIEEDIEFAVQASADYIILDGRGGGTGAAPLILRDNISVPTIPALARARKYLDDHGHSGQITLIITGGLRTPADFIKSLALGADGIALSNSALQAIGCVSARICETGNCPAGIATQNSELRAKFDIEKASNNLTRFFNTSAELMKLVSRACGHKHFNNFSKKDLTTWKQEMSDLSGVDFSGVRRYNY